MLDSCRRNWPRVDRSGDTDGWVSALPLSLASPTPKCATSLQYDVFCWCLWLCSAAYSEASPRRGGTFIAWAFLWNISSMSSASRFTSLSPSISSTRTARSNSLYFCRQNNQTHTFALARLHLIPSNLSCAGPVGGHSRTFSEPKELFEKIIPAPAQTGVHKQGIRIYY